MLCELTERCHRGMAAAARQRHVHWLCVQHSIYSDVMKHSLVACGLGLAFLLCITACSSSTESTSTPLAAGSSATAALASWPLPLDPLTLVTAAGLEPEWHESLQHHVHAHLDVFVDGQRVVVPGGIGIDITDSGVQRSFVGGEPAYGGIQTCVVHACISPLHTHDATGIIHTESATDTDNTLGEFFTEWGVKLDASCVGDYCSPETAVAVYVDGASYTGNPQDILLTNHKEIAIVIGKPPAQIPATADFSGA